MGEVESILNKAKADLDLVDKFQANPLTHDHSVAALARIIRSLVGILGNGTIHKA